MKKKKRPLNYGEKLLLIKRAGIKSYREIDTSPAGDLVSESEDLDELQSRINKILGLFERANIKQGSMVYFIMYDIEDNRIRRYIAKYLEEKGCIRVQKSIFLTESQRQEFNEIHTTLREVQEVYENKDSIMMVPVASDQLRAMKMIGQNIDLDLFLGNKNTLFF
ncbi:MAG: CRISPR-associated endonuclease Cas2 [Bacteroidales bacterium]